MAELTGHIQIFHSNTTIVDASLKATLGSRGIDKSGNEYIYLQGVASTVAGDWTVYDSSYATTRLVANSVGPIAIAMAAIDSTSSYGWYQVFGINTIARTDTVAANKSLYIDGTAGRADDLGVTGDLIIGAYSLTADTSNVATVYLNYPSVSNDLGGSSINYADNEIPSGAIDGSNPTFTLANTPSPAASLSLFLNGTQQGAGGEDFSLSGAEITFNSNLLSGSKLRAFYRY